MPYLIYRRKDMTNKLLQQALRRAQTRPNRTALLLLNSWSWLPSLASSLQLVCTEPASTRPCKRSTAVTSLKLTLLKECSLELISGNDEYVFDEDGQFASVTGTCEIDGTLTLFSESGDGETTQFEIEFSGGVPGVAGEAQES